MTEQKLVERIWKSAEKERRAHLAGHAYKSGDGYYYYYLDGNRVYWTPALYGEIVEADGLSKCMDDMFEAAYGIECEPHDIPGDKILKAYAKDFNEDAWFVYRWVFGGLQIKYAVDAIQFFKHSHLWHFAWYRTGAFAFTDDVSDRTMCILPVGDMKGTVEKRFANQEAFLKSVGEDRNYDELC